MNVVNDTISGKTTSRYQRSYRIGLQRFAVNNKWDGTYDIRVRRVSADSSGSNIADQVWWESYTEIVDQRLRYPNSALVGVQVDATQFRSIPSVAFDMRLIRVQVPINYDPNTRQYNGLWNGQFKIAWTDNPAWCLYDLITHPRYGLGSYISANLVDKWTLYDIARYCDELVPDGLGGTEPRFRCNVYLQTREEAIKVLQHFTGMFNGLIYWSGGALTVSADKPTDPVALFTSANVIDGAFNYVGTPLNQRHTTALVTWNDPTDRCRQKIEYVEDAEGVAQWGIRELQTVAYGCTSRGQAHRVGRWMLMTERYLSEIVKFKTGINAALLRPGDVFKTADPYRAGIRHGGRIMEATVDTITLDSPVEIEFGVLYELTVLLPDATLQTRPVLSDKAGTVDVLRMAEPFTMTPAPMAIWGLSSSAVAHEQWRCMEVTEADDGNIDITGVAYRPDKFHAIENDLTLQPINTVAYNPFFQANPTELTVVESMYLISKSLVGSRATFSWLAPKGAVKYRVTAQRGYDTPKYFDVPTPSVDIQPAEPGMWKFTVVAMNSIGTASVPITTEQELVGLNRTPSHVEDFGLDVLGDKTNLTWRPSDDLNVIVGGEIIIRHTPKLIGAKWEEGSELIRFSGGSSSGIAPLMKGTYLAKFKNSSDIYSVNESLIISTTGPLRDFNLVEDLVQHPTFPGTHHGTMAANMILQLPKNANGVLNSLTGEYEFNRIIDLGAKFTCRCMAMIEAATYLLSDDLDQWSDVDAINDVDGAQIDEGGVVVLVSTTDGDPADGQWSEWRRLTVADISFRAVRFKAVLTSMAPEFGVGVSVLSVVVDVPDRLESQNNLRIPVGGARVEFENAFRVVPAISIVAQGLSTGDRWDITEQSESGFKMEFKNSSGQSITKTCDWIARGYGYRHKL